MSDNFEKNTRTNSVLTLVSRSLGLVRDGALSRIFGPGILTSAFCFAFLIPNLFRRLFGDGALAAAFLPSYTKLQTEDPQLAKAFASLTISKLVLFLGLLTLLGEFVLWMILLFQTGENISIQLTMVMLPYMPLVCLVAIFGAMLHVHDKFGPTATAPIILNGFMIAATVGLVGVFANPMHHMTAIGVSVVFAGVVQVAWSMLALRKHGWFTRNKKSAHNELKVMTRRMLPMVVGLGTLQLNTLLDGFVANWSNLFGSSFFFGLQYPLQEGTMASLTWAQRLYQFPLGVFGIAVATAIYPLLAKQAKMHDSFSSMIRRGLRLVVYIGLPASAGLILIREPLVSAVFQGDKFTSEDVITVGSILLGYSSAVWAYSMIQVLTRGFYAKGDMKTPVTIAVICVALNFVLNVLLIWTPLGASGLAWSTAICAVMNVSLLLVYIRPHVANPIDQEVIRSFVATSVLTIAMSIVVALVVSQLWKTGGDWNDSLLPLISSVAAGIVVFVLGSVLMKRPELHWAIGKSR
ncbi:MAG: murein biosynthesis integral membrane protein MurJ [Phycisphaerae bacterium]|nr:murein biosynthesis integral membrane protein MurJ [Phycisphaerae bacterium]